MTLHEGYSTGVVDANEDRNTAHHTWPLALVLMWLS